LSDVLAERLVNHKLAGSDLRTPQEIVSWFGAVQAQDFPGARWALGVRSNAIVDADVVRAVDGGAILRTHVLRPTWHLVAAADIRWLVALTGPRILARLAPHHRQMEIDRETIAKSRAALSRALEKWPLTRREAAAVLQRARIPLNPVRLSHLLMVAEVEGLVCSGPLRDGSHTYALMDQRAPARSLMETEQALATLAVRYFGSHGPAAIADFAWWSGLSVREARLAVEMAGRALASDAVMSTMYRAAGARARRRSTTRAAWLLPNFDEYLVAYKDRAAVLGDGVDPRNALTHTVIIDGRAAGTWRLQRDEDPQRIVVSPRRRLSPDEEQRIRRAAARYSVFTGRTVTVAAPPLHGH
jgi:hypothetical protein